MPVKGLPWTLTIASDLRLLSLTRAFVDAYCQVCGLDDCTTRAVVMATDEATNNIRNAMEAALLKKKAANEKRKATLAKKKTEKEAAENAAKVPHNRRGKRVIDD